MPVTSLSRRDFIKVATTTAAGMTTVALVPSILVSGCGSGAGRAYEAWQGPLSDESHIRHTLLSWAILAPSSHNTQPWMIREWDESTLELYVDPVRLLPETDPLYRQIHVSQGTFIENFVLAARQHEYRVDVSYFPQGMYDNERIEARAVANLRLTKDPSVSKDPLFRQLLKRQTNRRVYEQHPLTEAQMTALNAAYDDADYPLTVTTDPVPLRQIAELATAAMQVEISAPARNAETLSMFRFNAAEVEEHRDGFGLAQTGMSGMKLWLAESFAVSRKSAEDDPPKFFRRAVELTDQQAHSAPAFGWITSNTNTRFDQVLVGRCYERVALTAAAVGLAIHPLSQFLQEYSDMRNLLGLLHEQLKVRPGHTIQMLFRIGHADPVQHSPRRPLDQMYLA
ncbi:twin-arginine translocation signal domain-containing protein [candidate division KSB1 bacterium]|nr:twin-arginine translocation signal domain-containing protein [candidate division KSB1 bacterium]